MSTKMSTRPVRLLKAHCWQTSSQNLIRRSLHEQTSRSKPKPRVLPARQASIHVPIPELITPYRIAKMLKSLRQDFVALREVTEKDHALVILATPKLVKFLEDSSFVTQILGCIKYAAVGVETMKFDVICGCVDGLPPGLDLISQCRGRPTTEGFTFLYGETASILPNFNIEKAAKADSQSKPGSITVSTFEPGGISATLPLANTLFTNGRISTLFTSKWQVQEGKYNQIESQRVIPAITLNAFGSQFERQPEIYIPAIPLTYAREISEGFGNIVKKIKFGDDTLPASLEIETKVPEFLKKAIKNASLIEIWAVLIPKDTVLKSVDRSSSTLRLPGHDFKGQFSMGQYKDIGYWISKGARLCRVQSGGGGWGAKAGLLSLNPETEYKERSDEIFDEISIERLGDIAREGQYIQFYTSRTTRTKGDRHEIGVATNSLKVATLLGTIPSSVDVIHRKLSEAEEIEERKMQRALNLSPDETNAFHHKVVELLDVPFPVQADQDVPSAIRQKDASSFVDEKASPPSTKALAYLRRGVFGFVSEGGMYIEQNGDGKNKDLPVVRTKVDVPYSFIYKTFGKPELRIRKVKTAVEKPEIKIRKFMV